MMENLDPQSSKNACELSPADQFLLDAYIDSGGDCLQAATIIGRELTSDEHQRLAMIARIFGCLDEYPVEDADPSLLHATLVRIDRHEEQQAERLRFDTSVEQPAAGPGFRIRLPDLISVAAVVLIGVGVLWPVLGSVRQHAIADACANNLRKIGYGFNLYSNDNSGSLPVAMAGVGSWENFRNAMNLNPLVQGGYCESGHLNCPGHVSHDGSEGEPTYSYRWFTPQGLIHWNTGRVTVILGDLNPLVDAARRGWEAPPLSVSVNHRGRGQNVLTSDGGVLWLEQPLIGSGGTRGKGDNIWMPDSVPSLRPGVLPEDDTDVFLVH